MSHFPTMKDVENLIKQEEEKKVLDKAPQCMQFPFNSHLSEDKRIIQVAVDIAIEYPEIPRELREQIAAMEKPIKGYHEDYYMFYKDELRIYRLFNTLQTLHNSWHDLANKYDKTANYFVNIYYKALKDIKESYKNFLEHFTYANPGEQKVSKIMYLIKEYTKDDEIIIPEY